MNTPFPYYAPPTTPGMQVAVIGAGYAGLAAAVTLAEAGCSVSVFEASRTLGGRARKVAVEGRELDNGQHILLGAYTETLRMMRLVGVDPEAALLRLPLSLRVHPDFHLDGTLGSTPWSSAWSLLRAKGLKPVDAWRAAQFISALKRSQFSLPSDTTVRALLDERRQTERLVRYLWEPLCLAALNTPIDLASAQVFVNVIRDGLLGPPGASDLLIPRVDLSALFPEPAAKFIGGRGGLLRLGALVRRIYWAGDGWYLDAIEHPFAAVVVACSPHHALPLLEDIEDIEATRARLAALVYQPIVTCYLQYPESFTLSDPMIGLSGGFGQWVFDRGRISGAKGLIAVIVSAASGFDQMRRDIFADRIAAELHSAFGAPKQPLWSRVIAERRAAFSCRPNMFRPTNATESLGLVLAGDYTEPEYPGTLESAARSGVKAARLVMTPASAPAPQPH